MKIYQGLSLLTLLMISVTCGALIGSFCNLQYGPWIGLVLILITCFFSLRMANSFLIYILKAEPMKSDSEVYEYILNLCAKLEIKDVEVFSTSAYPHNIFCFEGPGGKKYIAIGDELRGHLSLDEFNAVIYCVLGRLKSSNAKYLTYAFALSILFFLPFITCPTGNGFFKHAIRAIVYLYYAPFEVLRSWLIEDEKNVIKCDCAIASKYGINEPMASAFFKLFHKPSNRVPRKYDKISDLFSVVDVSYDNFLPQIFNLKISFEKRYAALRNHN